jgi:hypothetical protein
MTSIISNSKNAKIQERYNSVCENLCKFPMEYWDDLHYFITNHPGKTTEYHVNHYNNHKFTADSFEYLIHQINSNRNTFHNIGPFVNKNNRWYCKSKTKHDLISIINFQQKEIDRLKELLNTKN